MVWGGFKYLESRDLKLVAGLCDSRNRLAKAFPTRLAETRFLAAMDHGAPFPPWFAGPRRRSNDSNPPWIPR